MKKTKNKFLSQLAKHAAKIKINEELSKYDFAEPSPAVKKKMEQANLLLTRYGLPKEVYG